MWYKKWNVLKFNIFKEKMIVFAKQAKFRKQSCSTKVYDNFYVMRFEMCDQTNSIF
jgi:hypothetical protein